MASHGALAVGTIHVPYNWSYADAVARLAATGFVAADLGKLARQLDDNSLWILTVVTPTWVAVGNAAGSVTNAQLAAVATATFKGRTTAGTGSPEDLTVAQANALLQSDGLSASNGGFRGMPQNSKSANYTIAASDNGKHIYHPSADTTARTFTIDSNANLALPIGFSFTVINDDSAGIVTIAITTDTLVLAGTGTTGSRTLAANGNATAVKITATRWQISGVGLS